MTCEDWNQKLSWKIDAQVGLRNIIPSQLAVSKSSFNGGGLYIDNPCHVVA